MIDKNDKLARDHRWSLLNFLWRSYTATIDGRSRWGDVEYLAEAAERNDWAHSPEIGVKIAELLRHAYCKKVKKSRDEEGLSDDDIVALRKDLGWSLVRIAELAGMEEKAVQKVIERKAKAHGEK